MVEHVLENIKQLLCPDSKQGDVLQKFTALASNEHSVHVPRIDLDLHKTSKTHIQGTSCQHHEFCSTDSLLFSHKSKLGQIHCHLTLVRALVYSYYNAFYHNQLDMVVKGSASSLISQQSLEDVTCINIHL